jgi:hypothetical protein
VSSHDARPLITRRGAFLLLIGVVYVVIGLGYAIPLVPPREAPDVYTAALLLAPINVWGIGFFLAGVVGAVTAWWPEGRDGLGFLVLAGWSTGWATLALCSTFLYGSQRGWITGLVFLTFAGALMIVSGMDRGGDHHRTTGERDA